MAKKSNIWHNVERLCSGHPWPLGASLVSMKESTSLHYSLFPSQGINFAIWAPDATRVELCLFDQNGREECQRLPLPICSDGVWHGFLPGGEAGLVYGYRLHGPWNPQQGHRFNPAKVMLDPWAQEVVGRYGRQGNGIPNDPALDAELQLHVDQQANQPQQLDGRDNAAFALKARVPAAMPNVPIQRPHTPFEQTVLYEAHVRSLTMRHEEIPEEIRGSYAALAHPVMIRHYQELRITALNLLPIHFRADERMLMQQGRSNHWGYNTIAFLAPEPRYWSGRPGTNPSAELRDAISALHRAGIEVILDVVYNHTAEQGEGGPSLSFRGIANARYYHHPANDPAAYENWTGCGNSFNLSEPRVVELVIGSLRHWASHYGVDGFRFDLATTLGRNHKGRFSTNAPLFAAMQADPLLSRLKWIAEPWDIGMGGYRVGGFPGGWREWNDQFRDYMRSWWLQEAVGDRGTFARHFAGSAEQFCHNARSATSSINFITAHDGFTLRDLVSYNQKHNQANGEDNRDGHSHNNSWNCGIEGATDDKQVLALRNRLQRNLLTTLFISQGVPMLLAGDELGHSQQGNNNAYCQDNHISWIDWSTADRELLNFTRQLIKLRHHYSALHQEEWLVGPKKSPQHWSVHWHHPDGHTMQKEEWHHPNEDTLMIQLRPRATHSRGGDNATILLLINPSPQPCNFSLPGTSCRWQLLIDTDQSQQPTTPKPLQAAESLKLPARTVQIFKQL